MKTTKDWITQRAMTILLSLFFLQSFSLGLAGLAHSPKNLSGTFWVFDFTLMGVLILWASGVQIWMMANCARRDFGWMKKTAWLAFMMLFLGFGPIAYYYVYVKREIFSESI